jgi:Uma2 family endonuclease
MSTVQAPAKQRVVLYGVDWATYGRLLRAFAERPAVRLTYDRGMLEIMSPLLERDTDGRLLGRFVTTLTEELCLSVLSAGSTTFRRRKRRRGLEADECFWIANEPRVRGKRRINLRVDPPPDLAIEIDVTRSSLDRMSIYAALGFPEVWRLDGPQSLTFNVLQPDRTYAAATRSLSFPLITPADLIGFLALRGQMDENALVRQFRAWVRGRLPATPGTP